VRPVVIARSRWQLAIHPCALNRALSARKHSQ